MTHNVFLRNVYGGGSNIHLARGHRQPESLSQNYFMQLPEYQPRARSNPMSKTKRLLFMFAYYHAWCLVFIRGGFRKSLNRKIPYEFSIIIERYDVSVAKIMDQSESVSKKIFPNKH